MSSIENMWKRMLKDIYIKGHKHNKDDAEIKEILNVSGFILWEAERKWSTGR